MKNNIIEITNEFNESVNLRVKRIIGSVAYISQAQLVKIHKSINTQCGFVVWDSDGNKIDLALKP